MHVHFSTPQRAQRDDGCGWKQHTIHDQTYHRHGDHAGVHAVAGAALNFRVAAQKQQQ